MDTGVEQTIVWAMSKGGAGCRGSKYAMGTWGYMGYGGSLGNHAVSSAEKRRAGYKRSVVQRSASRLARYIEDNALIVQRTMHRRSRGVITRMRRPLRPARGNSWA